jgi:hypothetical protein
MAMTFATAELKLACESDTGILNILTEIRLRASAGTYGTPGPTSLEGNARHHHITNKTGIAWAYAGQSNVVSRFWLSGVNTTAIRAAATAVTTGTRREGSSALRRK